MVRSGVLFLGALGGGGCGTSASSPLNVGGLITMKMINNTSNTSMSGVTLIFALWPPLGPTAIPMVDLLYCPLAVEVGGAFGVFFLCSVSRTQSSHPAVSALLTTFY